MQKPKRLIGAVLGAACIAVSSLVPQAHGQATDALLDKLVDKGIISVKEANELREQADHDFNKAYAAKSGMPDWVTQFKIYGDVRGRYEMFRTENESESGATAQANRPRDRFRYRLRVGATATLMDNFEAGFRLTSSEANGTFGGDPISGNTTFGDNGSRFTGMTFTRVRWT
jgi:hypothetical protein